MEESQAIFIDADLKRMVEEILSTIRIHNAVISGYLENRGLILTPTVVSSLIYHCRAIGRAVEGVK